MGKHKKKQRQHQAERRRQQKRGERNARKTAPRGPAPLADAGVRLPPLDPGDPRRCFPAIHVDLAGRVVDDPRATLDVPVGADEDTIRAAWRAKLLDRPPERDPEGARRLLDARERLLDPKRILERELGVLHVPMPEAFGLPPTKSTTERLPAHDRLVGQLALYALLEAMELDAELDGRQLTLAAL